jgi:DNA-binding IclR family transcriptional regulator
MEDGLIKSAARALDVLGCFAAERRRMTAADIATRLGYPRSSANVLLKSMAAQGYLSLSPADQGYFPTLKVAALGDWLPEALLGSAALMAELERLRRETGETVTLTMAAGERMRVVAALIGTAPIALNLDVGTSFPMLGTAVGAAWLATLDDAALDRALARLAHAHGAAGFDAAAERAEVERARAQGHADAYDRVLPDSGAVAMAVRLPGASDALVLAVAGLNRRMRANEAACVAALGACVARLEQR